VIKLVALLGEASDATGQESQFDLPASAYWDLRTAVVRFRAAKDSISGYQQPAIVGKRRIRRHSNRMMQEPPGCKSS
jgi:hypothetical protein